jgi:hypothetical protein
LEKFTEFSTPASACSNGSEALELSYKSPNGKVANELFYRHDEARIEFVELGRPWSFDGALFSPKRGVDQYQRPSEA